MEFLLGVVIILNVIIQKKNSVDNYKTYQHYFFILGYGFLSLVNPIK